jgi:hypothetical protein
VAFSYAQGSESQLESHNAIENSEPYTIHSAGSRSKFPAGMAIRALNIASCDQKPIHSSPSPPPPENLYHNMHHLSG